MTRTPVRATTTGGDLVGWVAGEGVPVLLLHGGPVGYEYLDGLAEELVPGYAVAAYQRRGMQPSLESGPFDMGTEAADAVAFLDALGWDRVQVIGHSLGGYYALQLARRIPERVSGALCVDPVGAVGDGGMLAFWQSQLGRLPAEDRRRVEELDELGDAITPEQLDESMRLIWPTYFADAEHVLPFALRMNVETHEQIHAEVGADMPALAQALPDCQVPMRFVHGASSPMPVSASTDTIALLPHAVLDLVEGAGHFVWFERPGAVRQALDALVSS